MLWIPAFAGMTLLSYPRPPRLHYTAAMRNEPYSAPPFSSTALYIFSRLLRRGGSMRIGPLLRDLKLDDSQFADATNELHERGWIRATWRKDGAPLPATSRPVSPAANASPPPASAAGATPSPGRRGNGLPARRSPSPHSYVHAEHGFAMTRGLG